MLRPTAISVTVQKDYTLKVIFNNGETKIFDVKPYIKGPWYSRLKDFSYFSLAKADGFTVIWPEGQDICPDELYYNSASIVSTNTVTVKSTGICRTIKRGTRNYG